MKVIAAAEMARVEKLAYQEGASEEAFMEAAGRGVAEFVEALAQERGYPWEATLLCGKGNNGGDAYVAGAYLIEMGYKVRAVQVDEPHPMQQRFLDAGGELSEELSGILIDGLFGTGFHGEVKSPYRELIERVNEADGPVVSIDIASGGAVKADYTVFLGAPKREIFDHWECAGVLYGVDFGLDPKFLEMAESDYEMVLESDAAQMVPTMDRTRHKYQAGYVVGIAGSKAMPGAAILSTSAALKAGAGMVRLIHPADIEPHALGLPPEILVQSIEKASFEKANAIFAGPGLGENREALELALGTDLPTILDADALNMKPENFPKRCIITPHHGEMARLLDGEVTLESVANYAQEQCIFIILKGAPTFVLSPDGKKFVIPRGDPGMATAGCGDVLTGVVTALVAQGCSLLNASILGAYLHAMAGELAAHEKSSYSMDASDLTDHLGEAFNILTLQEQAE